MNDRFMPKSEVARYFGISTRSVDYWVEAKRLPVPERLPNGRPAWRQSVIESLVPRPHSHEAA
jgi:predicted DNA-binding transcriptional regulator AlpA